MLFQHLSRRRQPHKQHQKSTSVSPGGSASAYAASGSAVSDVEIVASAIEAAGMIVLASLALQVGRPLSWIGGQILWMLQPFAEGFGIGSRKSPLSVPGLAHLLESDGGVDSLVERLEAGSNKAGAREGWK